MIPLAAKRVLQDQAAAAVAARRATSGLARTGQVARSTVAVGDDDVLLDDVLVGAVDTSLETEAQSEDIAFLDEDQVDSFDAVISAGDTPDVDFVLDAQEADPDLGDEWEASAAANDEAHGGRMSGIEANAAAVLAAANADRAILDASQATETALGNARYRQVDGGAITPPMPEGGFRVGAELVRLKIGGTPYQVDVWNGTDWNRAQVLADQILVPGENGTIAIGDAQIYSPTIIGGEFYGNTFEGGLFDGGKFVLRSAKVLSTLANDTFESTNPWDGTLSTAQKHSGARSILAPVRALLRRAERTGLVMPANTETVRMSAWVYSAVAGDVSITARYADSLTANFAARIVAANTWTQITGFYDAAASATGEIVFGVRGVPTSTAALYVDDVVIEALDAAGDTLTIERTIQTGEAEFRVFKESGQGVSVGSRGILLDNGAGKLGTIQNDPFSAALAITAYQTRVDIAGTEIRLRSPVLFESTAKFQGDTAWVALTLTGATGTMEWKRSNNRIMLRGAIQLTALLNPGGSQNPVASLPVAARPDANVPLLVKATTTTSIVEGLALPTGNIVLHNMSASSTAISTTQIISYVGEWDAPGT